MRLVQYARPGYAGSDRRVADAAEDVAASSTGSAWRSC
jgi:hypothetical protein